ncbi:MAG: flagellar assembly protein FliH [Burkholderiaceae bacterium]|nr:flagellar assembly protein FliH [Burkholderiaceae bacterium]
MAASSDRGGAPPGKTTGRPEFSRSPGGRAPQGGDLGGQHYARFIPREELDGFAAWRPDAFGDSAGARPASEAQRSAEHQTLRQAGYQDGYRDGLVALESFKQGFAQQMAAQLAPLVTAFDQAFAELESQIAGSVARTATALARQVVRSELAARPALVAQVAAEAVNAVLLSARHIRVFVHADDQALVQAGAGEALAARGASLQTDATLARGGCRIESDLGQVDARIQSRWAQAAATLGQPLPLNDDGDAAP